VSGIKGVVWDLDGTVWPGVAIEGPEGTLPAPAQWALETIEALEERGIVNSVASRTDPVIGTALAADPVLGRRFVAPQLGWGDKSHAIRRIAETLGVSVQALVFVDDSAFERAEVTAMLPGVLVLSPQELRDRFDELFPADVTDDARARPGRYREEQERAAAEAGFAGSREDFLRSCEMVLTVRPATPADVPRIAELAKRTHRFNTTGEAWPSDRLAGLVDNPSWFIPVIRLRDRFGDYGQISTALIERPSRGAGGESLAGPSVGAGISEQAGSLGSGPWRLRLLMVSCRAAGREVPAAVLGWLIGQAHQAGATAILADVRADLANVELRMLLRQAGFTAAGQGLLTRDTRPLPGVSHIRLEEERPV
jgi:methoxymalonate biosynthesis protein